MMSDQRIQQIHADCTTTLEFFSDRPAEPTFSQQRNNLHAMEVTGVLGGGETPADMSIKLSALMGTTDWLHVVPVRILLIVR